MCHVIILSLCCHNVPTDTLRNPEILQLRLTQQAEEEDRKIQSRTGSPTTSIAAPGLGATSPIRVVPPPTHDTTLRTTHPFTNEDVDDATARSGSIATAESNEEEEEGEDNFQTEGMHKSLMSNSTHIMSVTSLLQMKREKVEMNRRQSIMAANAFAQAATNDTKINSTRALSVINNRMAMKR